MKDKIKNLYNKTVNWVKEHKKIVIGGAIGLCATALTIGSLKNKNKDQNNNISIDTNNSIDNLDYGRDCIMKFVVDDDSQELLGEIPCTESYAKEELEAYKDLKD